jgi:hypothetical protein
MNTETLIILGIALAMLLLGLLIGWVLGRAATNNLLASSRELRGMYASTLQENQRLRVEQSRTIQLLAQRASKGATIAAPPSGEAPLVTELENPSLRNGVVLNEAHRQRVRARRERAAEVDADMSYRGMPQDEDEA